MVNLIKNRKSSFLVGLIIGIVLIIIMVAAFYVVVGGIFKPPGPTGICLKKFDLPYCNEIVVGFYPFIIPIPITVCGPVQRIDFEPISGVRQITGVINSPRKFAGTGCKRAAIIAYSPNGSYRTIPVQKLATEEVDYEVEITDDVEQGRFYSTDLSQFDLTISGIAVSCNYGGHWLPDFWIDDFSVHIYYECGDKMLVTETTPPYWSFTPAGNSNTDGPDFKIYDNRCLLRDANYGLTNFAYFWIFEAPTSQAIRIGLRSGCMGRENCTENKVVVDCFRPDNETGCQFMNTVPQKTLHTFEILDYDFVYSSTLDVSECVETDTNSDYFNSYCLAFNALNNTITKTGCWVNGIDIQNVEEY